MIRSSACPSRPPDPSRPGLENDGANRQLHHRLGRGLPGPAHLKRERASRSLASGRAPRAAPDIPLQRLPPLRPGGLPVLFDQQRDDRGPVHGPELAHDVGEMRFDRALGYAEFMGDILVLQALSQ